MRSMAPSRAARRSKLTHPNRMRAFDNGARKSSGRRTTTPPDRQIMRSEMTATTEMWRVSQFPKPWHRGAIPPPATCRGHAPTACASQGRARTGPRRVSRIKGDVSDLSAVAGVSERTQTRGIQRPARHAANRLPTRAAALREVRRTLLGGPFERDPVTRSRNDFGFWHLSRFAGQYRALFGESPSQTVARGRMRAESG